MDVRNLQPAPTSHLPSLLISPMVLIYDNDIDIFYSSEEGEVFSWGSGYGGKLGQGHLRDRATPLRVAALKDMKVTNIACHEFHSAAVCGNLLIRI